MKVYIGPFPGLRSKKERKVSIQLHPYDTWSLDHTLALIIHPALIQLKETNHGFGSVDKEDVPETLLPTYGQHGYNSEGYSLEAWQWVMDELIWTFEQIANDHEIEGQWETDFANRSRLREEHHKRVENGLRLFGKYYTSLWD